MKCITSMYDMRVFYLQWNEKELKKNTEKLSGAYNQWGVSKTLMISYI